MEEAEEGFVCSVTYMRVRHPLVIPAFVWHSARVALAARRVPGNVSVRLLGLPPLPFFWTLTVWESEAAMAEFVATPKHAAAMPRIGHFARVGKFARFPSATRRVGWRTAWRQLRTPRGVFTPTDSGAPGPARS
ncbi:MAG TPA: antibiotic biosynthesis monooxygenase [Candidatus Dormibacteraeota bacterium]|jgi:heme-degrading monooxygenase HmoA|nr:antibiotic biosynthesis monooxygenase [Candidatus Dormibacteraeota bacterium]